MQARRQDCRISSKPLVIFVPKYGFVQIREVSWGGRLPFPDLRAHDPLCACRRLPEPRVGHAYRLVLHACRVADPHPLLHQRPQLLAEPLDLLPACSPHVPSHRNLPSESPAAQQEARVRYRILRQVLYAGTVANDIAQVFCRQVDCLFYFFLTAFRVSPEILGGRPELILKHTSGAGLQACNVFLQVPVVPLDAP